MIWDDSLWVNISSFLLLKQISKRPQGLFKTKFNFIPNKEGCGTVSFKQNTFLRIIPPPLHNNVGKSRWFIHVQYLRSFRSFKYKWECFLHQTNDFAHFPNLKTLKRKAVHNYINHRATRLIYNSWAEPQSDSVNKIPLKVRCFVHLF